MEESERALELQSLCEAFGAMLSSRRLLLRLLELHFKCEVPEDVSKLVNRQDDLDILHKWFDAALDANSMQNVMDMLKL